MASRSIRSTGPAVGRQRAWEHLSDPDLLQVRIGELGVRLEDSEMPALVRRLHREMRDRGLLLQPHCFLADEWFSPEGQAAIGIPFYLAHPRLRSLEYRMMFEVEGGSRSWAMRLLRHEAGHALDHAFGLSRRPGWSRVFGSAAQPYHPHLYSVDPRSRHHVVNLPEHYAQAHPEEDYSETFAVWLNPRSHWRSRYRGWPAMAKLEYVDGVMRGLAGKPPPSGRPQLQAEAHRLRSTLAAYYRRKRRLYRLDDLAFTLPDLRGIFTGRGGRSEPAARFLRRHRRELVAAVAGRGGDSPAQVARLVTDLARIAEGSHLALGRDETRALLRLAAYLASLTTTRFHTQTYRTRQR